LQGIKSDDVFRKIRSEALSADDYDKDDFHDIVLMCSDKENNFVKHVGIPSVHCYSNEQLDIIKNLIKKQKIITGYLDATGTLVRRIDKNSKRILYYVLVVNVPLPRNSSVMCPVVEMISPAHDIVAISQWLNAFKAFVLKHKLTWPVFTNIVKDFSYAQMNALCIGWNVDTKIANSTMKAKCIDKYQLPNDSNDEGKDYSEDIYKFLCESNMSNSTMFCRFQSIKEQVKSKVSNFSVNSENIIINEYHDESYLHEFILNKVINGIKIRQSNATGESWFKTVKIDILEGDRRLKCDRFLKRMRERVMNIHKQMEYNIRKNKCTRALNFDSKSKQSTIKGNGKINISEISSHKHFEAIESWGKKEKQHKHLQPTKYGPFTKLSLKIPKSSTTTAHENNLSPKVVDDIERVVFLECDN
ncbi:ULP PROTEASE domain-containing protein, partial [Aphis craccivora]